MRCDDCGKAMATANEISGGDWVCDACALAVWTEDPELVTGGIAVVRETLRTGRQDVFADRARARKAELLATGVRSRRLEADVHAWLRPQWLALAVEVGVKPPSPDTVEMARKLLGQGAML